MTDTTTATTVFEDAIPDQVATTTPAVTLFTVDEHSVYKSVDELLEGAKQKSAYIKELTEQNAALRAKVEAERNVEDFRKEIKLMLDNQTPSNPPATTGEVSEDKIAEIAQRMYQTQKAQEAAAANLDQVNTALTNTFGGDAKNKMLSKLKELGMTEEAFKAMSAATPTAALKLLDIIETPKTSIPSLEAIMARQSQATPEVTQKTTVPKYRSPTELAKLVDEALKDPSIVNSLAVW